MQEHREVLADRRIALGGELRRASRPRPPSPARRPRGRADDHEPHRLPSTLASTHVNRESQAPDDHAVAGPGQHPVRAAAACICCRPLRGQAQILVDRRPIKAVVADPKTPASLRDTLAEVSAARDFAIADPGPAGQPQLSGVCGHRSPLRGVERGRRAGVFGASQGVVLPGRRLRHLPRLLPPEIRAGPMPTSSRRRAMTRWWAACRPIRPWGILTIPS